MELTTAEDVGRLGPPRRQPGSQRPLHVLHVVESLGSGVAATLEDYLHSTPEHRPSVLACRREGFQIGDHLERLAAQVVPLPSGRLAPLWAVRHWIGEPRPDVVHAPSPSSRWVTARRAAPYRGIAL